MRADGNTRKLDAAKTLIRAIAPVLMEKVFLCSLFKDTFIVIGQVRKDSALYDLPTQTKKEVVPGNMGKKYRMSELPVWKKRGRRFFSMAKIRSCDIGLQFA